MYSPHTNHSDEVGIVMYHLQVLIPLGIVFPTSPHTETGSRKVPLDTVIMAPILKVSTHTTAVRRWTSCNWATWDWVGVSTTLLLLAPDLLLESVPHFLATRLTTLRVWGPDWWWLLHPVNVPTPVDWDITTIFLTLGTTREIRTPHSPIHSTWILSIEFA